MMSTANRERRDRSDEIHQAAIEVFCAKGFAAASVKDVADAVGLLKGSLYHYVSSKDEMLRQIFLSAAEQTEKRIADAEAPDVTPTQRLRLFVESQVVWYLEHLDHGAVLLREWRYVQGGQRKVVAKYRRAYEEYLRSLIVACVDAGHALPDLDVAHALHFVLGAVDATPQWYQPTGSDTPRRVAQIYADLTLGAVLLAGG